MTDKSARHLFIGNLAKNASVPEAIYATYVNLLESKSNKGVKREFKRTIMEPFLDMCYGQPNASSDGLVTDNLNDPMGTNDIQDLIVDVNTIANKHPHDMRQKRYKELRQWKSMDKGNIYLTIIKSNSTYCDNVFLGSTRMNPDTDFILRLLSYNILAQNLLETHSYLYKHHNGNALDWKRRKLLVQQEIIEANANVSLFIN